MNQYKKYLKLWSMLAATLIVVLATACSGTSNEEVTALESDVTALESTITSLETRISRVNEALEQAKEASVRAQVIGTLRHIEAAEFHMMNIHIQEGDLNPRYPATIDQVVAASVATEWPSDLSDTAEAFIESAKSLSVALVAEDANQAGPVSTAAHGLYHALSHAAFVWLNGGEELGADPHAGHDMSSGSSHEGHGTDAKDHEDHSSHGTTTEATMDHSDHGTTTEATMDHSDHEATAEPTEDPHAGHDMPTATPDPHAGHKMD